ncbi:MAG: hypothetical protein ACODAD_16455 [Planctomycetota bacterium]
MSDFGAGNSYCHVIIFQAVGFFRVESCPTQAVLPLVGLAADKIIRDWYLSPRISPMTRIGGDSLSGYMQSPDDGQAPRIWGAFPRAVCRGCAATLAWATD